MERAIECAKNVSKGIQWLPARIKDWLNSYCLVTFFCALLLVFVHVTLTISLFRITAICLSANSVVENYEIHRLFTYTLFHTNWIHLIFNVIFLSSVGNSVEQRLGSIYLLNMLIVFSIFCALVQLVISTFISIIFPNMAYSCVAGFSAVLFAVLVLEVRISKNKRQSIYGMCSVPRSTYPWLLLIACQVMTLQNVSFIGHLSGIVTGYMFIHDLLHFCKLSANSIITIERSELCHWITTLPGFVPYPRNLLLPLAIPLPYKDVDKGQQSTRGASHAPIVLPSNQQPLDSSSSSQAVDKDHMSKDQLNNAQTIANPEII